MPTNNLCMDYEGVEVKYQAGQPYVGAIVVSHAGPGGNRGEFMAWDANTGKKVWGIKENLAPGAAPSPPAGDVVFYGTMEGWLKAVNAKTGDVLWKFKTPSGIIGNPMTYVGPGWQAIRRRSCPASADGRASASPRISAARIRRPGWARWAPSETCRASAPRVAC